MPGDASDSFTYENLNRAFRLFVAGAPLLATQNPKILRSLSW